MESRKTENFENNQSCASAKNESKSCYQYKGVPRFTWRKEGTQIRKRVVPELTPVQLSRGSTSKCKI